VHVSNGAVRGDHQELWANVTKFPFSFAIKTTAIMAQSDEKTEFTVPSAIKDFVFDLHDAMRRSVVVEEVQKLYDVQMKEITDKFFAQSPWPEVKAIASEVNNDEGFLLFYRFVCFEIVMFYCVR
jgi:hypothetical protein